MDCPTLEFEYGDADGHAAELSGMNQSGQSGVNGNVVGKGAGL